MTREERDKIVFGLLRQKPKRKRAKAKPKRKPQPEEVAIVESAKAVKKAAPKAKKKALAKKEA